MTAGLHLSLLGIDGAGKTSIARALASSLREKGYQPRIVSWKDAIRGEDHAGNILASISMAAYKLQFAEAEPLQDSRCLRDIAAIESTSQFFQDAENMLRRAEVRQNRSHPLVSAALVELAGSYYLHHCHVLPLVRDGEVVIEESCGFKHVLKNALMAQRLEPPGSAVAMLAEDIIDQASALFGEAMKPNAGYWVDVDPQLALAWRRSGNISSTNFEDYGLIGAPRDSNSFISMQSDCRLHFASYARRWGWGRLEMIDVTREQNLRSALSVIENALPGGP